MKGIKISKSILIVTALVSATGISIDTFSKKSNKQPAGTLYAYPGTNLRMMVDQTCGACHANKHFTTAGGFDLDSGAGLHAGGVLAQSLSIDPTTMVGNDPLTSLLIQKPLADSSMPHGGPKLDLNHPTIQALISYVQNGAPSAELDRPAQPPLSYYGASPDPLLVYVRSKQQPGGFRRVQRASSLPDVDGDIWLMRFQFNAVTQQNDILSNVNLTNFPDDQEVRNPSPSLDGSKICFSRRIPGNPWHIWEINSDGTGLRQITTGSHNQIQPFYLPYLPDGTEARAGEGGVGYLSDESDFREEYENSRSFLLFVCDANGSNVRQLEFNPSHDLHPRLHSSGLAIFPRWEHNQHQRHNFIPIFAITASDYLTAGTNLFAAYGEHHTSSKGNSLHSPAEVYVPGYEGYMIAQGSNRDDASGSLVGPFYPKLTQSVGNSPRTNVIVNGDNFEPGRDDEMMVVNVTSITYRDVASLLDRFVVSKATITGITYELMFNGTTTTTREYSPYGLYTFNLSGGQSPVLQDEYLLIKDDVYHFFDAEPLLIKQQPPKIGKPIDLTSNVGTFTSGDIRLRDTSDGQPSNLTVGGDNGIVAVRFLRALQFSQGRVDTGRENEGIGTQIVGEAPISSDGSFSAEVPANVPMQFQLINANGQAEVVHKPWVFVAGGVTERCVGCHASHAAAPTVQTLEARQGPSRQLSANSVRQFHFDKDIQPILTAKCASCHDSALRTGAAGRNMALSLVGRDTPAGVSEAFQSLIGTMMGMEDGLVVTQNVRRSPLMWWLTGLKLDANPQTPYPNPAASVPHDQILSQREMATIQNWIASGVNFRVVDDNIAHNLRSLNATEFETLWETIFEPGCMPCHDVGGAGASMMDLGGDVLRADSEEEVMENRLETIARRANFMIPEASTILRKPHRNDPLTHVGGKFWDSSSPEYLAIYRWIASANPALAPGVPGTDLHSVTNFPNPFRDVTTIVYGLTGAAASTVDVKIYAQNGKLIREFPGTTNNGGTVIGWNRVDWDGKDKNGKEVGNDVYFYTIDVKFEDGVKKTFRGKCVKIS